jgi:hypothetical protein
MKCFSLYRTRLVLFREKKNENKYNPDDNFFLHEIHLNLVRLRIYYDDFFSKNFYPFSCVSEKNVSFDVFFYAKRNFFPVIFS